MDTTAPPRQRKRSAPVSKTNRSALSNGRLLPPRIDGRSALARRYRDLYSDYRAAMAAAAPTAVQDALLRSLAATTVRIELIASQAAAGAAIDDQTLVSLINVQGRLMQSLGIAPQPPEPEKPDPLAAHRKRMGWDP